MRPMTVCHRTLSGQQGRGQRRGRLLLPSILLVLVMLAVLSIPACSKEPEVSTRGATENKAADKTDGDAELPKMGGHTFSSDLRLDVFIIHEAEWELEWIGATPSARPLDIPRGASWGVCPTGRGDMKALAREIAAKKIPHLRMERWAVDDDLAHLKGLTGLRRLGLWDTKITDAGLAHLKGLTELRQLYLWGTKITDAGLAHLKGLTGLRKLNLEGTKITDAGLAHLKDLTGLRELSLQWTQITDTGLAHLKGLTGLRELNLWDTKITDAGLAHLKGLTGLRWLGLLGTRITDAGLADLKKALPRTNIHR